MALNIVATPPAPATPDVSAPGEVPLDRQFVRYWLIGTILGGYLLAVIAVGVEALHLHSVIQWLAVAAGSAGSAWLIGRVQASLLRPAAPWAQAWRMGTTLGWAVGGVIGWGLQPFLWAYLHMDFSPDAIEGMVTQSRAIPGAQLLLLFAASGAALGQQIALMRHTRWPWWWTPATAVCWISGLGLTWAPLAMIGGLIEPAHSDLGMAIFVMPVLAVLSLALIIAPPSFLLGAGLTARAARALVEGKSPWPVWDLAVLLLLGLLLLPLPLQRADQEWQAVRAWERYENTVRQPLHMLTGPQETSEYMLPRTKEGWEQVPPGNRSIRDVAFSPGGQEVAAAASDDYELAHAYVYFWRTGDWTLDRRLALDSTPSSHVSLAYSPDGSVFAVGKVEGAVLLYHPPATTPFQRIDLSDQPEVVQVHFSPDGRTLFVVVGDTPVVQRWATATWQREADLRVEPLLWSGESAIAPDGQHLAVLSAAGQVVLYHLPDGARVGSFPVEDTFWMSQTNLAFAPDGRSLAVSCDTLTLHRVPDGHLIRTIGDRWSGVSVAVAFTPDGSRVVDGSGAWQVADGQRLARWEDGGATGEDGLTISPDGRFLALGSDTYTVGIWELP